MNGMTFDTLAAAKALREAGFEERQTEAVAEAVRNGREGLATKADSNSLATKIDLGALEARFYRALWMQTGAIAGTIVAAAGVVVAVVKFL